MVIFASPNQYFIYFTEKITVVKKRGNYSNFKEGLKYWYFHLLLVFPWKYWEKSTTAYYILLIKSVGMNTEVHLIDKDI